MFSIGLIVTELLTNIMKYAFDRRNSGIIEFTLLENIGNVTLIVHDNGIGLTEEFNISKANGFGLTLVEMLSRQLNGSFTIEIFEGTKCIFEFCI